jgi:hypothetical protein
VAVLLFTGLVAGAYPALFMSRFRPANVLQGGNAGGRRGSLRRVLVVTQFALSIGLICATGVVYSQMGYMRGMEPGYDREHVLALPIRGAVAEAYPTLKNRLLQLPGIAGVTASSHRPSNIFSNSDSADWDGRLEDQSISLYLSWVDCDYVRTNGMDLVAGRDYAADRPADWESGFVINQAAARIMGMESPVGERLSFGGREGHIIGVVRDFHFESLRSAIEPLVLLHSTSGYSTILVRVAAGQATRMVPAIGEVWRQVVPEYPFDYSFLSDDFDRIYLSEARMSDIMTGFAGFALFIACLGLFGLAAHAAERRTREIGIRKALGATEFGTILLLCREFLLLVGVAVLIAWPVTGWIMDRWLDDFAYRTALRPEIFILAGGVALVIALLTVSSQAWRAARTNPVDALRYE